MPDLGEFGISGMLLNPGSVEDGESSCFKKEFEQVATTAVIIDAFY